MFTIPIPTMKYGRDSVMWGCIAKNDTENIEFSNGTMNKMKYLNIFKTKFKSSVEKLNVSSVYYFQQDNYS